MRCRRLYLLGDGLQWARWAAVALLPSAGLLHGIMTLSMCSIPHLRLQSW